MVTRQMLFPLAFYRKAKFNGSRGKWNYRIERSEEEGKELFLLTVWEGPFCYDVSKEEKKISRYSFDEAGMAEILRELNALKG